MTPERITQAEALLALGHSRSSIARTLGIGRASLNRALDTRPSHGSGGWSGSEPRSP